ncbi:MAG: hypothetical protein M1814_005808 [Vezdaea aestivalis]|nr:MAG: hypothetical protein M1814_005808 [Vezdaea aestivalis]
MGLIQNAVTSTKGKVDQYGVFLAISSTLFISAWFLLYASIRAKRRKRESKVILPEYFSFFFNFRSFTNDPLEFIRNRLKKLRQGICSTVLLGNRLHFVSDPHFIQLLFRQPKSQLDSESITLHFMHQAFGVPRQFGGQVESILPLVLKEVFHSFHNKVELQRYTQNYVTNLEQLLAKAGSEDFAQVSSGPTGDDKSRSNHQLFNTGLFTLVQGLAGRASLPTLTGITFFETYSEVIRDLWEYDNGFIMVLAGLPRWVPSQKLRKALDARQRILNKLKEFVCTLDKMEETKSSENPNQREPGEVSELAKTINSLLRKAGISPEGRSGFLLSLIWAMQFNFTKLIFWFLTCVLADPALTEQVRSETAPFVVGDMAQRLHILPDELKTSCPLLKACYYESLRLYSQPWSVKKAKKAFVIKGIGSEQQEGQNFLVRAGDFINVPYYIPHTEEKHFNNPMVFAPERFLITKDETRQVVKPRLFYPFGGGISQCKGAPLAEGQCLSFVAAVLAVWEVKPTTDRGKWRVPEPVPSAGVMMPVKDPQVLIQSRMAM